MFFEEFETITNFGRKDVTDRSKIIPPSSEPCRKPENISMITEEKQPRVGFIAVLNKESVKPRLLIILVGK